MKFVGISPNGKLSYPNIFLVFTKPCNTIVKKSLLHSLQSPKILTTLGVNSWNQFLYCPLLNATRQWLKNVALIFKRGYLGHTRKDNWNSCGNRTLSVWSQVISNSTHAHLAIPKWRVLFLPDDSYWLISDFLFDLLSDSVISCTIHFVNHRV